MLVIRPARLEDRQLASLSSASPGWSSLYIVVTVSVRTRYDRIHRTSEEYQCPQSGFQLFVSRGLKLYQISLHVRQYTESFQKPFMYQP